MSKAVAPTAAPAMPSEAAAADSPLAQARLASDLARATSASGSGWPSSNPRIRSAWASSRSLALLRPSISISRAMPPNRASRANAPDRPPHTILSIAFLLCACPAPQKLQHRGWVGAGDPFSFDHDLSLVTASTQCFVHRLDVELFGIELATDPLQQFLVSLVFRVEDRLHELRVAPRPAAVLRWAGPLADDAAGVADAGCTVEHRLHLDHVVPIVPEAVGVG